MSSEDRKPYLEKAGQLFQAGDDQKAQELLSSYLEQYPDDPRALYGLSLSLMRQGKWEEGWNLHEARLQNPEMHRLLQLTPQKLPRWKGESLQGRCLLIQCEQGLGDTIQFLGYLQKLPVHDRIAVQCHPLLISLLKESLPQVRFFSPGEQVSADFRIEAMSLPHVLGIFSPVAIQPWIKVPSVYQEKWAPFMSKLPGPLIGLCWRGNPQQHDDNQRSVCLRDFLPLLQNQSRRGVSLQINTTPDEEETMMKNGIIPMGSGLVEFADTAAAISHMNMVVSVDTSVMHLSSAMGKPTHLILPRIASWRWGLVADRTPWYPLCKLWRPALDETFSDLSRRIEKTIFLK
ncbi:tetratricopeptide repeat protein [Fibrobacterota bacterium]